MHDFYGTVFLRDDPDSVLDAKVIVDLNRIVIKADGAEIGSWRHADVKVKRVKEQIFLEADGEMLVLELDGREFFLDLLGVSDTNTKKSRRSRRRDAEYEAEKKPGFSIETDEFVDGMDLFGVDRFTLGNAAWDHSFIAEQLGAHLGKQIQGVLGV